MAGAFLIGGLTTQHQALLRRQMRFGALAAIEISALVAGIAAALLSALYGAGYWALVIMHVAREATSTAGVWILCDWRPGPPARRSGVGAMVRFGGNLTGYNVVNYMGRNLDDVLLGRFWGTAQLGLYSKAYQLLVLPLTHINAPISSVVMPGLSRLQGDAQRLRNYYLGALAAVTSLTLPVVMATILLSGEIVQVILGSQWREAVPILRILAISAFVQPICNTAGWLYTSTGRTRALLRWGVFASACIVAAIVVGLPYGAVGVALCYSIAVVALAWPCMDLAIRGTAISMSDLARSVRRPVFATAVAGAACLVTKAVTGGGLPAWGTAMVCLAVMAVTYYFALGHRLGRLIVPPMQGKALRTADGAGGSSSPE
jgi:PST family polysaccharide transporter